MQHDSVFGYGLWSLVFINSAIFIIFAFSFTKPKTQRDWRSFGAFSAFIVALFTEMYGIPLTIYLLLPWLTAKFPGVDFLSHDSGHLLEVMFGWRAHPHFGLFHIVSNVLIFGGFIMLAAACACALRRPKCSPAGDHGHLCSASAPAIRGVFILISWPAFSCSGRRF